ncbi:putative ABC transporter ATP-binding protein YadG [Oligella sp. MSHR50489EDL]|uniref:ABC transporter ATP-binding protein n=1 Tax=Oligella sp. MSHR50489EDL TaxID=3139409 RepID=UPI003D814736
MENQNNIVMSIKGVSKSYDNGFTALKAVNLDIHQGEILALLGPNGAGKTTLIGIITGLVNASGGEVIMNGLNTLQHQRQLRQKIGLVPQELLTESFETVLNTVRFSRGLFGLPANPAFEEQLLKDLSLWDKRHSKILSLSGGMKRRVLIAKALIHEPEVLFLDEPTAGVDVELRHDLWRMVRRLSKDEGLTVILTTHYIEEAEDMADRIAVINGGEIILVEEKDNLMQQLGKKSLCIKLKEPLAELPKVLQDYPLELVDNGQSLLYTYHKDGEPGEAGHSLSELLGLLTVKGIEILDLTSQKSSLEEIFVSLLDNQAAQNQKVTASAALKE